MASDEILLGLQAPQQARSRASLQRILAGAEAELAESGLESFTVAAVASRAGMSIGAIYHRFAGKDQLLTAVKDKLLTGLEHDLAHALQEAGPGLEDVVRAYVTALTDGLQSFSGVLPDLVGPLQSGESEQRGGQALATMQRLFLDAVAPHLAQVARPDRTTCLTITARMITSATIHRTQNQRRFPDGISWATWTKEIADMAIAYLTSPVECG